MIRILSTALLALSLTVSGAFATSMDDLVERDGLYYKKFTETPFTGKVDEGREQGKLRRGKREGPWFSYYENGQLREKGAFKNGEKEGPWVGYHSNGQLWFKGEWQNDKQEGPGVGYHSNGRLKYKGTYKNDKREGPWVEYNLYGSKDEDHSAIYRNGEKISD